MSQHYYKSTLDPLAESDRESFMSGHTVIMPPPNRNNLDPLGESDRESVSDDGDLRGPQTASYSLLDMPSRSDIGMSPRPELSRHMSLTGTHFDVHRPPTNASTFTVDTEYRRQTLPFTSLAPNYYSRVPSGSTDGRVSTSSRDEEARPLTETADKDPYLVCSHFGSLT
jgi:hypothetical protein